MKKVLIFLLIFNLFYSGWLYFLPDHRTHYNYFYNVSFGLFYLLGFIGCVKLMKECATHRLIHLTLGLGSLSYFIAQVIWFIYNVFLETNAPYPGIADFFYLGFYLLVGVGGLLTMRSIKIQFSISKVFEIVLIASIFFLIIYSYIQSTSSQESVSFLTQMFNLLYPALDAILISLTLAAIRSHLGSLQPLLLFFMGSFILLGFGDTLFAYQDASLTYWNGNISDVIFMISGFLFVSGLIRLPNMLHSDDNSFNLKNLTPQTLALGKESLV
ncbi:MAG: hypothetical protein WCG44_03740 [bacterium]